MSQADELLNSLITEGTYIRTANPETEAHIVIGDDRYISIPEELKRIAVQFDHDIETVTFDCPRYWDGMDMSGMKIYVNYMLPNNSRGMYLAKNVKVDTDDSTMMHFDWTISGNVTLINGSLTFLVCIKKTDSDGNEEIHWNSELNKDMYISEGLECTEAITSLHPDIITDLLLRMDYVEDIATPENMQNYVSDYLNNDPTLQQTIEDHIFDYLKNNDVSSYEMMQKYINKYLGEHPPLFVIGPTKPGVACLWFDTSSNSEGTDTTVLKLTSDDPNDRIYAEVDDTGETLSNIDVGME